MKNNLVKKIELNSRKYLFGVLVFSFLIRILISIPIWNSPEKAEHRDTYSYHVVAKNLMAGHGFSNCEKSPYYKDVERTPIYPYFLVGIYSLFGEDLRMVVLVQILLDVALVYVIFLIGLCLWRDRRIAIFGAFFYSISSHAITYSTGVLTESFFTLMLSLLIFYILKLRNAPIWLKGVGLGIGWGILVMCRPIALYTLPLLLGLWYMQMDEVNTIKRKVLALFLAGIIAVGSIYPWMDRNESLTGVFTISSISNYNIYGSYANAIVARQSERNENETREELLGQLETPLFGQCSGRYEYVQETQEKGMKIIKDNFFYYCQIHFSYFPNMLLPEITKISDNWNLTVGSKGTLAVINESGLWKGMKYYYQSNWKGFWLLLPFVILWVICLICAARGIWSMGRHCFKGVWIFLFLLMGYYIFLPGPVSSPRFMYPIIPLICLLAGNGMFQFLNKTKTLS